MWSWPVLPGGFLYDRSFFVQNSKGTSITLKHHSGLARITPVVDLKTGQMILQAPAVPTEKVELDHSGNTEDLAGRVCGRRSVFWFTSKYTNTKRHYGML